MRIVDRCRCGAELDLLHSWAPSVQMQHERWLEAHRVCRERTDSVFEVPTMREMQMVPTIGRIVIYKSKIDNGPGNDVFSPAVVLRTRATCVPAVIDRWGPEPTTVVSASDPSITHQTSARPDGVLAELPDDTTVDLLVHGLGRDYREYAVSQGDGLGQWDWPERV